MTDEWETIALERLIEPGRGISYGIVQPGKPVENGVPIVRVSDIRNGRIATENPLKVSFDIESAYSRTRLKGGELLLTLVGTVGEAAVVPDSLAGWNTARAVAVIPVRKDIGSYWVKLALHAPSVRQIINSRLNTTVQATLNLGDVVQLPIILPPRLERDAIAHILGTLDDKIELNRRMNATLEEMARALFKSWFVDFDPVRAKMEGRDTGLPREIADLFPDGFEESELGEVPKGWRVDAIGDVVKAVGGTTPSTKEPSFWDGDISFATPKDLAPLSSPVLLDTERCITQAGLRQISSGLLPVGTVLMSSRAPIGYLVITEIPVAVNQGFIAMICGGPLPNHYVLHWARHNMETIIGSANGTTFLEISKANFRPIQVLVPPESILMAFVAQVDPLHRRVVSNLEESRTLAALRDTLLPKLISGEVRVPEAERMIGHAV